MKKTYSMTLDFEKMNELDEIIKERGLVDRSKMFNKWLHSGVAGLKGDSHV